MPVATSGSPLERLPPGLERFLQAFTDAGFDASALRRELVARAETKVERELDERRWFDAWVATYAASAPPLSALVAGAAVPFGAYHVIDYLVSSCATVGVGFDRLGRYLGIVRPHVELVSEVRDDVVRVSLVDKLRPDDFFFDEWTMGVTVRGFRETLKLAFTARACAFRRPRPADAAAIARAERFLGGELSFGAELSTIELDRALWDRRMPADNPRMHDALELHARELLAESLQAPLLARRLRAVLGNDLADGPPSMARAAKRLGLTARTLQRRLQEERTTFQAELDAHRADLARRYLADGKLGVSEIAFLLGYADASAFARAHRRWFGSAPAERRRAQS